MISKNPYIFSRICEEDGLNDRIVAGLELKPGKQSLDVSSVFADGTPLMDYYSGEELVVKKGKVELDTEFETVLLGRK
jgi:alpha-amylase